MDFIIEKTVPMPIRTYGTPVEYPFASMTPGDSFFAKVKAATLSQYAREWARSTGSTAKFITRIEGEGARIWRKS